ncbi:MAG: hypothetical protein QXS02_01305 [Candidatus Thermoplasmatota archaeon]
MVKKKITVGIDEFCPNCMEWREFDEAGRCKVCGKCIRKSKDEPHKITDEYDLSDFTLEQGGEE